MIFDTPPGQIVDATRFPFVVMRDRLGIFVLADRLRIYCMKLKDARQTAAALKN